VVPLYTDLAEAGHVRPLFCYILVIAATAFIVMFFVSQRSRQVQIGYELTRLRQERAELLDRSRKLDFEVSRAASHDALAEAARKLGLTLQSPASTRPTD